MTLYHFPRLGLYAYASTGTILKKGLKKGLARAERPAEVELNEGEILRIDRQGRRKVETFNTENLYDGLFLGHLVLAEIGLPAADAVTETHQIVLDQLDGFVGVVEADGGEVFLSGIDSVLVQGDEQG